MSAHRKARFEFGDWERMETGAPVLMEAIVNFDCRVKRTLDADSHTTFPGAIVACRMSEQQWPLL